MLKYCVFLLFVAAASSYNLDFQPIVVPFLAKEDQVVVETLLINNAYPAAGDWGPIALCPVGSSVQSAEVKWHQPDNLDETAINAIKLYCQNEAGTIMDTLVSSEADKGEYRGIFSCEEGTVTGVRVKVLEYQGIFIDDVAIQDFNISCNYDHENIGVLPPSLMPNSTDELAAAFINDRDYQELDAETRAYRDGEWSLLQECSIGLELCGLQARVEPPAIGGDQVSLADVIFFCCDLQ